MNFDASKQSNLHLEKAQLGPHFRFAPLPDITAYELALCLPYFYGKPASDLANEPITVRRHFRKVEATENG